MSRENFGVYVIWSPQISRRQTWMDHRRQEGRRGRSADHPERSRRDRSAHHPERRSLGSQPGWDKRCHVAIWHAALLRGGSHIERSKGIMPSQNALHFLQFINPVLTWCAGRTVVTG